MGKIIERVRARDLAKKERVRKENPFYDLMVMQQQRLANQQNVAREFNQMAALQNPYPYWYEEVEPENQLPSKPWWRFW